LLYGVIHFPLSIYRAWLDASFKPGLFCSLSTLRSRSNGMEGDRLMAAPETDAELTPLEQIRQCEAEGTRRVLIAREAAEKSVARATQDAEVIKKRALEAGSREGQMRYREIISKATEEAELLVAQAKQRAEELRRNGDRRMEAAVRLAVNLILGMEKKG
jgi:hypothetical protein